MCGTFRGFKTDNQDKNVAKLPIKVVTIKKQPDYPQIYYRLPSDISSESIFAGAISLIVKQYSIFIHCQAL